MKRRDASSILVAILLAMIISQPLATTTTKLASRLSGIHNGPNFSYGGGNDWKSQYLFPVVWALLQIVVLEILCWIVVFTNIGMKRGMK